MVHVDGGEGLQDGQVQGRIRSFLQISSIVKATDAKANQLESVINRIVQQNIAAKVQPVSSFAWSSTLKSVAPDNCVRDSTFEEALQAYNNHPADGAPSPMNPKRRMILLSFCFPTFIIGSMYGIFTYIFHKHPPNVGKYTIHGWYGIHHKSELGGGN